MAKYKIGITEAGDAGLDLSWTKKMAKLDGAVVITKNPNDKFRAAALKHADKLVVHITVTGYGGSILEKNVPTPQQVLEMATELVKAGFPADRIVIRVDPIIPTEVGLNKALGVMMLFMGRGFTRYRVSVLDMYNHVKARFKKHKLPLPYGTDNQASDEQFAAVNETLKKAKQYWAGKLNKDPRKLRIESCAETKVTEAKACGCVSEYDLKLLGLEPDEDLDPGRQRPACLCYSGKKELLTTKHPCEHGCLYCYWQDVT